MRPILVRHSSDAEPLNIPQWCIRRIAARSEVRHVRHVRHASAQLPAAGACWRLLAQA